jgi:hypothetical protein
MYREQVNNIMAVLKLGGLSYDYELVIDEVRITNYSSQNGVSAEKRERCRRSIDEANGLWLPPFVLWHPDAGRNETDRIITIDGHTRQYSAFHDFGKRTTSAYILLAPQGKFRGFVESVENLHGVKVPDLPLFYENRVSRHVR